MSDTPRTDELSARVFGGKFNMLEVVNAFEEQCAHFERELTTAIAALAAKDKEIERLTTNGVHTCHAECERPLCVADRQLRAKERQVRELVEENYEFRAMCAVSSAGASLYLDDGELQDTNARPWIDWKRDSAIEIQTKLAQRTLAQHPAPPSPGGDTREEAK